MELEAMFSLANLVALSGWVALLATPLAPRLSQIYAGQIVPAALALLYAGLVLAFWSSAKGGFGNLAAVTDLFATPQVLLAGWVHYLAFDLLVGAWQVRSARAGGIGFLPLLPCLALTFLFGPIGLLLFLGVRAAHRLASTGAAKPTLSNSETIHV